MSVGFLTHPHNIATQLVGGIATQLGMIIPNIWKIPNVTNHQPVNCVNSTSEMFPSKTLHLVMLPFTSCLMSQNHTFGLLVSKSTTCGLPTHPRQERRKTIYQSKQKHVRTFCQQMFHYSTTLAVAQSTNNRPTAYPKRASYNGS